MQDKLCSAHWFDRNDAVGFNHRTALRSEGFAT